MKEIRKIVQFNFYGFYKNSRVIMTFLLGFILCFLLSTRALVVTKEYASSMQIVEPFIWTFGDSTAILLSSMLLILLFADLPKFSPLTTFYLVRTNKIRWVIGQIGYVVIGTFLYVLFMLFSTSILCARDSFVGNMWSKTAAMLAHSKLGEYASIPSTVKVMESIRPYQCMVQAFGLLLLYSLMLSMLMLIVNIKVGKNAGIFAGLLFSLYGFLLTPATISKIFKLEEYELYKANILLGWISPLNHSTYGKHNFGYDQLPTLMATYLLFFLLLSILTLGTIKAMKRYQFS